MNSLREHFIQWTSLTILNKLDFNHKKIFRKYEKLMLQLTTTKAHRSFNETCRTNKLLPTYTNGIDI